MRNTKAINELSLGITEAQFSAQVEDMLKVFGWRYSHFRPARVIKNGKESWRTAMTGDKGFPDIVAVRNGMCLFIELKSESGKLSPDQLEWATRLKQVATNSIGIIYCQWKPSGYDEVVGVLR